MTGSAMKATPWWLSTPALLLFTALLLVPLLLTAVLSFNVYDAATGPRAGEFTLDHYVHLFTDSYYYGIFWRTFWISALVAVICVLVGTPEAYVLSRMRNPWRSNEKGSTCAPPAASAAETASRRSGVVKQKRQPPPPAPQTFPASAPAVRARTKRSSMAGVVTPGASRVRCVHSSAR